MLNFIIKYTTEIVFLSIAFLIACTLSSNQLLVDINFDYSFIVFFACLFMLFLPVFYLAAKNF